MNISPMYTCPKVYSEAQNKTTVNRNTAFTGGITRCPYTKSAYNDVKKLYSDYKFSLNETSLSEIKKSVENISTEMGCSKEEVLWAMQNLTQFANIRSVKCIGEVLKKYKIGTIGNVKDSLYIKISFGCRCPSSDKAITDDFGLHKTMDYLLNKKKFNQLNPISNMNTAIFLDETKVAQLETLQNNDEKVFKAFKNMPRIKYFMISGWDSGITFVDRTKNLETETRNLISNAHKSGKSVDEVLDAPLLDRIHKLGINPVVIKNQGISNITGIYKQITPEKMYESELFNTIDAYLSTVLDNDKNTQMRGKELVVDFLKNNLKIYTPENLSMYTKRMYEQIREFALKRGKTDKDILYILPDVTKSSCLINYMYSKINNIPHDQFYSIEHLNLSPEQAADKILVILDDCSLSGASIKSISRTIDHKAVQKADSTVFACISGTKKTFPFKHEKKRQLLILDEVNGISRRKKPLLSKILGYQTFAKEKTYCLAFPYMAPDNNNEFSAIFALLHNANYRSTHKANDLYDMGVKSVTGTAYQVFEKTKKLAGSNPVVSDKEILQIEKEPDNSSFMERIKRKAASIFNGSVLK